MGARFKGLQTNIAKAAAATAAKASNVAEGDTLPTGKAKAREGKKAVVGYFSEDMSRALRVLAIEEGTTVQALIGEALDLLLRQRGKHPFGER